eukprot:NODE_943_length_2959_cov_0.532517.p2 type:complete len:152 gc:universal NODE_943_length_2959_cov_0.532517:893-438(-)
MAKKKSTRKPAKRIKLKLDTQFNCLNCNQENSVSVKMNRDKDIIDPRAVLMCRLCNITYSSKVNNLSQPVDVYHDWVDNFEKIQERMRKDRIEEEDVPSRRMPQYQYQEEEDDEIVDDEAEVDIFDKELGADSDDGKKNMRNRVISESDSE